MLHSKFWQGFFALVPILLFLVTFVAYFFFIFSFIQNIQEMEANGNISTSIIFQHFIVFFVWILATILVSIGSLIFYIVHAVQNPNLKENNMLIVWILIFVFIGGIGQLIYWIVEILNKRQLAS